MNQKCLSAVLALLILCPLGIAGVAFLIPKAARTNDWIQLCRVDALPSDGSPIQMPVVVQERDAWIVRPDRRIGDVFVRLDPESGQVVAFDAITRYGAIIEWDGSAFRERRCWDFEFDLNGKCRQAPGTYDLVRLQAVANNDAVFIRWAH